MQVIILGMHRSGTSAVARVLNMMGAYLAPEQQIMPPTSDNPKGYWERLDVMQLNDRILQAGNSDWQNVLHFDAQRISASNKKAFRHEINKLVCALDANRPWMLKDPRLCITFPLWREHLELPICIHVYRNPLQVARSLHKRDGIPITAALAMWETHVITALNNSRGLPNIRLIESAFMHNPLDAVQYLKTKLEANGVDGLRIPKLPELTAFIDINLLHHTDNDTALDTVLNKQQLALWQEIQKDNLFDYAQPLRIISEGGKDTYINYLKWQELIKQCKDKINILHKELTEKSSTVAQLQTKNSNEIAQLKTKNSNEIAQLQTINSQQANNIEYLNRELASVTKISSLEIEHCYEKLQEVSLHHAECEQERVQIVERFSKQQALFDELRYNIEATFMSWRWKIGNLIISSIEKLLGRNNVILAKHRIEQILRDIIQNSAQAQLRAHIANITGVTSSMISNQHLKTVYTQTKHKELNYFLDNYTRLAFNNTKLPIVSIVLVVYNRAELTLACLKTLQEITDLTIEIIIIDNASTDRTSELLNKLYGNVKIIRNEENIGFLLACNQAALQCTGEYILFLNNDAILLPNALTNALQVFQEEANVGAVGARIILLDGTLQEAGSIVWQDGSCYGYGRGGDPTATEFMFRRSVDYCSGAFLLIRRDIYTELNGFDPAYAPAYYEETDLCLRLRQRGLDVIYEPSVAVLHYEFASSKTNEHALELQRKNRITFVEKHAEYLATRQPADLSHTLIARGVTTKPRILYIDDRVPHIKYGAGFPRSNFMLKTFAEQYSVTLMPLNFPDEETWDNMYSDIPKRIEIIKGCGRVGFIKFLTERKNYFNLIFISRPHNMEFFIDVRWRIYGMQNHPPIIYDAEAVFAARDAIKNQVLGGVWSDATLAIKKEIALVRNATRVIAVSEQERHIFLQQGITTVDIIGHAVTIQPSITPYENRTGILFIGNMDADYSPNVDSIVWFVEKILDELLKVIPDLKLLLIGSNKSKQIQAIQHSAVRLLGIIDDTTSYYENCRLMIAPTRFAAGLPYKVHEAAARGLPVVCSELIRTQLGWGEDAILAADINYPDLFAHQVLKLYQNVECWQSIREGAIAKVTIECDEYSLRNNLLNMVQQTL